MRYGPLLALLLISCRNNLNEGPILNLVVASSAAPAAMDFARKSSREMKMSVQSGASSVIARQIVNGMKCDVVILADNEWMDYLARHGMIEEATRKPFLSNRLVFVERIKKKQTKNPKEGIALADPIHVPLGKYAKALLISLGMWDQIAHRVVPAPDARTALFWAESGEVESAIVYETDALSSAKVRVTRHFDEDAANPIRYPIAKCKSEKMSNSGLYERLTGSDGLEVFRNHGFRIVMPSE